MPTISELQVRYRSEVTEKAKPDAAALTAVAEGMDAVSGAAERVDQKLTRASQGLDRIKASLDGNEAATRRMSAAQAQHERRLDGLNVALGRGQIDQQQYQALVARSAVLLDQATALAVAYGQAQEQRFVPAQRAATQAMQGAADGADKASHALRGLGIQSIDVFQQLASGAPVMITLIQQGSQVAQQSAAMGVSMGTLARGAASVVASFAPAILAFGSLAVAAGAAWAVLSRASDLASQQRALSVAIQGVGRSAELSSTQLQTYVRQLERQGVASGDALASVAGLARNGSLSAGTIGRIASLGPDAAAALGTGVPEAMERLARAARGGMDAIQELSDAFNLLTPAEEANIRRMIEHGDRAAALDAVFEKLTARVQGLNEEALSPSEKLFRQIANAWDDFMLKVANSTPVLRVLANIRRDVEAISQAAFGPSGEALSQQIVAANAAALTAQREAADASQRLGPDHAYAQRLAASAAEQQARVDALIERARRETARSGLPSPVEGGAADPAAAEARARSLATPADAAGREIDRAAAARAAGAPAGQVRALTAELERYKSALDAIPRGSDEWAARAPILKEAIAATAKAIEDATKKGEEHLAGLEKTVAAYDAQTRAAQAMEAAHRSGADAVARVRAQQEAEAKIVSEGLIPGTAKYAASIVDLTARVLAKSQAEAGAKTAERLVELKDATDAQLRINAAYDGTEASVTKAQNAEKAASDARRAGLTPDTVGYTERVRELAQAYDQSSAAADAFRQSQASVQAVLSSIETAADRIGQSLVDGFINGRNAAVTMASVARAAFASLATSAASLGLINPLVNGVLGTTRPTLWSGLGTLAGGGAGGAAAGGGGGLFSSLGNALSLGRLSDSLGLTNFGSQLSGVGRFLGISGENGLFSGVGNLLNTQAWGTVHPGTALLDSMGITAGMPGTGIPTIGELFGGVGLGFSAGSLLGGALQRTFNRTGPAPTIGAGLGAGAGALIGSFIPGVGTLIGGLAGGLLGGGTGSLIGPRPATPFSATGLTVGSDGLLSVGRTISQLVGTEQEVQTLTAQVEQLNAVLRAANAKIANAVSLDELGQERLIGGRSGSWLNFGQGGGRPSDLSGAWGELRFSSSDATINRVLAGREFASPEALAQAVQEVTSFVQQTAPTLIALGQTTKDYGAGTLAVQIEALQQQFDAAIETAGRLEYKEAELTAAREKAIEVAQRTPIDALIRMDEGFSARFWAARAVNNNDPRMAFDAQLLAFDARAKDERDAFSEHLLTLLGEAGRTHILYIDQMAQLDRTLYEERLTLLTQYNQQVVAAEQAATRERQQARDAAESAALGTVSALGSYARGLAFSAASPLSAQARFNLASQQFNAVSGAAIAGDFRSMQGLPDTADTLLAAAREIYGSGSAYVAVFERVRQALDQLVSRNAESLVVAAIRDAEQSQTAVLASKLEQMAQELAAIKTELRQQSLTPRAA